MKEFDEMKLARLIDACGGVDGRVKMQKIVYFLTVMGYDLPYKDFAIRQQGPYSRAVACDTDVLKNARIIDEKQKDLGVNDSGEAVRQYLYTTREQVVSLIRKHFEIVAPEGKPDVATISGRLRECERAVLEVAATKVYLQREEKLSGESLDDELRRLKGHLSSRFAEANALLEELRKDNLL